MITQQYQVLQQSMIKGLQGLRSMFHGYTTIQNPDAATLNDTLEMLPKIDALIDRCQNAQTDAEIKVIFLDVKAFWVG